MSEKAQFMGPNDRVEPKRRSAIRAALESASGSAALRKADTWFGLFVLSQITDEAGFIDVRGKSK